MFIGRVIGDVVSTIKHPALGEKKLLIVERLDLAGKGTGKTVLAFDTVDGLDQLEVLATTLWLVSR